MIDRDIILEKINGIQRTLAFINRVTKNTTLDDIFVQDVVVLNLQRAVQLCIDMAGYLIASLKLGLPATLKDSFIILQDNKIIDGILTNKMCKMVGFRNIAVHNYQKIDIKILQAIINNHLSDFEEFYTTILNCIEKLEKS